MKIYENILKGRVKYPPYIHPDAQDLLQKLITPDLTKRLGNLHGGSKDVMNHPWFAEVTWERLQKKDIDAPYVPPVRAGVGDASQFDKYPEETEAYGQTGDDPYVEFCSLYGATELTGTTDTARFSPTFKTHSSTAGRMYSFFTFFFARVLRFATYSYVDEVFRPDSIASVLKWISRWR